MKSLKTMHSYTKILKTKKIDFEFVEKISKIHKHDNDLDQYDFIIDDKNIDLRSLTEFVKNNLGSKYCMAHLEALKIVKSKIK